MDLASPQPELPSAGSPVTASERFNRVSWGNTGSGTNLYPLGLVAGGLEDGTVHIWDPNKIIQGSDSNRSTVVKLKKHNTAVRALEFNPTMSHMLATGSTESEVILWDLTRASIPTFMPPMKDPATGMGPEADMTFISWNRKVQQILASCSTSGKTAVWDTRRQKPVASLLDLNSQRRCSVLQWNPEVVTQVLVASDDDRSPTMQLWDLRNSVSPLKEFVGHTKGIKGMSWCPHDPYLMLSCATDGRTFCWDVTKAEIIGELPPAGNWHLDIQWSPVTPGLFSVTTFDGTVGICSLGTFMGPPSEDQYAQYGQQAPPGPLKRAPAWLRRPVGVSFGFGGKLVSFSHKSGKAQGGQAGQAPQDDNADIKIQQVTEQGEAIPESNEFVRVVQSADRSQILSYCSDKSKESSKSDSETWKFLSMMFSQDAKRELMDHLGFKDFLPIETTEYEEQEPERMSANLPPVNTHHTDSGSGFFDNDHADFFDNFGDGDDPAKVAAAADKPSTESVQQAEPSKTRTPPKATSKPSKGKEDEIQRALLVKNYSAAVEACFSANRLADALLIAKVGGEALYAKAATRYMEEEQQPFMGILSAVAENDFQKLVSTRLVSDWRETLAMLVAYVNDTDSWVALCNDLGIKLAQAGREHESTLCFICGGNVNKAVALWMRSKKESSVAALQDVMQKAIILGLATQEQTASDALCELGHNYASILAAQGSMENALEYLDMIPGELSESIVLLRSRILGTSNQSAPAQDTTAYAYNQSFNSAHHVDQYGTSAYYQSSAPGPYAFTPAQPQPVYEEPMHGYRPEPSYTPGYNPNIGVPTQQQFGYHPPAPAPVHQQPAVFTPHTVPASPKPFTPAQPVPQEPQPRPNMFVPVPGPDPGSMMGGVGMSNPHQPLSPTKPLSPPTPQGPPSNISIQTVDSSKIPPSQKPIVASLTKVYQQFESAMPSKRREIVDTSKRLGTLFWHLNNGDISESVVQQLLSLAKAFDTGDYQGALAVHSALTQNAWTDSSSLWLTALKRLLKLKQGH